MLNLGSTYLIVNDIQKSIAFYEKLLEMKVSSQAYDRWAQFDFNGKCIGIYNKDYDRKIICENKDIETHYNDEYIKYYKERTIRYGNNMVLNFWIDDLSTEYERINQLKIGRVSEINYVNFSSPYYFFVLEDPDGNTIEITGYYKG